MQGWMPLALDALGQEGVPEPVGVVAAVAEQPLRLWQLVQQRCRAGVVAHLAGGHEEAQGAAVRVGDGMQLRIHAALGAADQAAKVPLLTRRLEAVRCAFRQVASIITVPGSASAAANPSIIRVNTPLSPQRFLRL